MAIERRSRVVWEGDLLKGNGNIEFQSSGLHSTPVTWASRTEDPNGKTSPEELMAAAHAACFSMALSATLARSKHPPKSLDVSAKCTLDKKDEGFRITDMHLTPLVGEVDGMSEDEFIKAANEAKEGCPVSNALKNNVNIHLDARLK
ncbi:hypothetical protein IX51_08600 [uncultured archaeon]|nr:hypothetical protein IX51_08600 [uncultured archaeon]